MKQTEELPQNARLWNLIELKIEYGYFAKYPPVILTCYSNGELTFIAENLKGGRPIEKAVYDYDHSVSKKSLVKLDGLIEEIAKIEYLEGDQVEDGPSFECHVRLANGTVTGYHYVSMFLNEKFKDIENRLRKTLREEFFLNKHKKEFGL